MTSETLIGLIMMLIIGPAIGNYATSVVYRLPRGQTPFEKHPYCGSCNTLLAPKDLFPIWSYVFLRGKCRYCGVHIPPVHTVVEVASGLLFVVNFLVLGFGEPFLLLTALGVFWIMLAALEHQQGKLYPLLLSFCFFLAALPRLMADGSIYPTIQSGFILFVAAVVLWRIASFRNRKTFNPEATGYRVPPFAILAALAGVCLPLPEAATALAIAGVLYAAQRLLFKWNLTSAAIGVAVWGVMLIQSP